MIGAWLKMVVAMLVALTPGGFPLLLTYITTRTLLRQWRLAQEQAQGRSVSVRQVLSTVHFRDLVREARTAF